MGLGLVEKDPVTTGPQTSPPTTDDDDVFVAGAPNHVSVDAVVVKSLIILPLNH